MSASAELALLGMLLPGLLGAVGALGCGGGDEGEQSDVAGLQAGTPGSSNTGSPSTGSTMVSGAFGGSGSKDVCKDSTLLDRAPALVKPTGTAHFKPIGGTTRAHEEDMVEVTCEVSRNAAGEVVGFYASFFDQFRESFLGDFASVSWSGKFTGPGQYDDARLSYAFHYDISDSGGPGQLVIESDGLTGHLTSPKGELDFKCGDAAKLSLQTVPWPAQPERTVRAALGGVVYEFPGLECGTDDGSFEIGTVGIPYIFNVTTDGSGTGSHRVTSDDTDYAGGAYKSSSSGGGTLTLDCGASPVTGKINDNITFVCGK